mmetsp:Transcript_10057/g.23968  ORF Transcript_10057/g.23968 Transcript_10057/m.23968 type:complete len:311 (+) Transcript_10057:3-935(+)
MERHHHHNRKMIIMALIDDVAKIGTVHLMIEGDTTNEIEVGKTDGGMMTGIVIVQETTGGELMIRIVAEKIQGDDTRTGIVAGKTGVDMMTEIVWEMKDVDMTIEVVQTMIGVGMTTGIVVGKIGVDMRTEIVLLMIVIPDATVIETETTRIGIVETDGYMKIAVPMVPLVIITWITGDRRVTVMIIVGPKVGVDGIVTIIAGMTIDSQGDGMIENHDIQGTKGILIDNGTAVLPTAEDHEMEMIIVPNDERITFASGKQKLCSGSNSRFRMYKKSSSEPKITATVQRNSATLFYSFQLQQSIQWNAAYI